MPRWSLKSIRFEKYSKFGFEFLSILIAVLSAFALNNWNENRKDRSSEVKILSEIYKGLEKDLSDISLNIYGHKLGIDACTFWRSQVIGDKTRSTDSLYMHYKNLTRNFITEQNTSGYENLKSKGLELVRNDSLRYKIISIYEYNYKSVTKLEEEYSGLQFHKIYFTEITRILSPSYIFDTNGKISGIKTPIFLTPNDHNILFTYLDQIQYNRAFALGFYKILEANVASLMDEIQEELNHIK